MGRRLCYLLNMSRLKSWNSRSLFLSRNPSMEYLQQMRRPEVSGGTRSAAVSTEANGCYMIAVRRPEQAALPVCPVWLPFSQQVS